MHMFKMYKLMSLDMIIIAKFQAINVSNTSQYFLVSLCFPVSVSFVCVLNTYNVTFTLLTNFRSPQRCIANYKGFNCHNGTFLSIE